MRSLLVAGLVCGCVAAVPPAAAQSSAARVVPSDLQETSVLQPGDALRVEVWRQPELSGEFKIAADGTLLHPLYRGVQAGGLPLNLVEQRVRSVLEQYELAPQFVVEPLLRVTLAGEVRQPRLYTFSPEVTVAAAVALAGGATERGHPERARLLRGGTVYPVDLTQPVAGNAALPIRSGDQIVVPRRRSVFREYVAPLLTVSGATAAIINVIQRNQ